MSTTIMEAHLCDAMNADPELLALGFVAARNAAASGVIVSGRGGTAGVWHWRNGTFELEVAGAVIVALETVAEAVRYTRERLGQP